MKSSAAFVVAIICALTVGVDAQTIGEYGQCGGIGYTGGTTCTAPYVCVYSNPYYSQCLPASSSSSSSSSLSTIQSTSTTATSSTSKSTTTTTTTTTTATATTSTTTTKATTTTTTTTTPVTSTTSTSPPSCATSSNPPPSAGKVKFAGVNIAGFDFGCNTAGTCNTGSTGAYPPLLSDYGPDGIGQMQHFVNDDGFNVFRLPVAWQYLTNNVIGGTLYAPQADLYGELVQGCLATGAYCLLDIHNYARWQGDIIGQGGPTNDQFAAIWTTLASNYSSESKIIFGVMNEPHDLPSITIWAETVQAAVTAIRGAGATSQMILLPGSDYASAAQFISDGSGPALLNVTNPDGSTTNLMFDIHKYLDSDNSGTSLECVTNNIDTAFAPLAQWLRCNGRQALLSETGGGNSASCVTDLGQQLSYISNNSDVYLGYIGWAAGSFGDPTEYTLSETPTDDDGVWTDTELVAQALKLYVP